MSTSKKGSAKAGRLQSDRKNGKTVKIVVIAAATVAVLALIITAIWYFTSPKLVKLTVEGEKYIDKSNGITYLNAPINYEPAAIGDEYAKYGDTVLYAVSGYDTSEMLTEAYEGVGSLYYADTVDLPGLDGWQADACKICISEAITIQSGEITDADELAAIVAAATGEVTDLVPGENVTVNHLKFTSALMPGLYYDILYLDDGTNAFFYNRSTKEYRLGGELLLHYLPRG